MHKAESIILAAVAAVTGLTTTGARVYRGRAYAVAELPSLSVYMGEDRIETVLSLGQYDRFLELFIEIHVQQTAALESELNQIRAEVFAALRADPTLGGLCINIEPTVEGRPDFTGEQDIKIASQQLEYQIYYRHSSTTAEA